MVSIAGGRRIAVIIMLIVSASPSVWSKPKNNENAFEDKSPNITIVRNVGQINNVYRAQVLRKSTTRDNTDRSDFLLESLVARIVALSLAVTAPVAVTVVLVMIVAAQKRKVCAQRSASFN